MRVNHSGSWRVWLAALCILTVAAPGLAAQRGNERARPIAAGESCPPGTTEIRPRTCMGPEGGGAVPSILDYKPRSTLVVPGHPVPRAKYPVVDFHGHPPPLASADVVDRVVGAMEPLNLRLMIATGQPGRIPREQMLQDLQVVRASKHKDRFAIFANIDFRNVGPGFGKAMAEQLGADVKAGAVGLGEVMKDFGLTARNADGSRLKLD